MAVVSSTIRFVDRSRQVVSGLSVLAKERVLPTEIWMPKAPGRFPLVVFVHGFDAFPDYYARFCSQLASAGYVVAAPSFPLEDPTRGFGLNRDDLPNEATDVSFLIGAMHRGPLRRRLDRGTAVVGHSDGADVALMVGYQRGKADPRVGAIVADAPDPMKGALVGSRSPLLLVQGNADTVVPYSSSQAVFRQVSAPRYYLTLLGADHVPPIFGSSKWTEPLDTAVADFLDATVAGRGPGVSHLSAELHALPYTRLETRAVTK
jgi:predicted dienelactone hydrolase